MFVTTSFILKMQFYYLNSVVAFYEFIIFYERDPSIKKRGEHMISEDLLDILVCPKCKGPLHLTEDTLGLVCEKCRLVYEIRDDIPIMLIEEAKSMDE